MIKSSKSTMFNTAAYSKLLTKDFASYAMTFTLTSLVAYSVNIFDNIFSGIFLGEDVIASIGLIFHLNIEITGFTLLIPTGATVISAHVLKNKDIACLRDIFSLSIVSSVILDVACSLIVFFGAEFFAGLFYSSDNAQVTQIYTYTVEYLKIYSATVLLYSLSNNFLGIRRIDFNPKLSLYCAIALPICNLIFKFFFIQFNWGIQGISLFAVLSYMVIMVIALISCTHFLKKSNSFRFPFPKDGIFKSLVQIFNFGSTELISEIVTFVFSVITNLILVCFVGHIGLVAYAVLVNVEMIGSFLYYGVNQTAGYVSALLYRERNRVSMRQGFLLSLSAGFIFTVIFEIIVLVFPGFFANFFSLKDQTAYATTMLVTSIYAVIVPLDTVVDCYSYYFNSCSRIAYTNVLCFMQYFLAKTVFMLVVCPILLQQQVDLGVWYSYMSRVFLYLMFIAFLLFLANIKATKANYKVKDFIDWLLDLPAGFDSDWTRAKYLGRITSIDLTNQVSDICQATLIKDSIPKDKAMAIAIEEMSRNTFEHGYKGIKRKQLIEITFVKKPKSIISLRFRDNARSFNLLEYGTSEGDAYSNIDIRLVGGSLLT